MKELIDFQQGRITALTKRVSELERYIIELCDKDCPNDYKRVVLKELRDE